MKKNRKARILSVLVALTFFLSVYQPIQALTYYMNANNVNVLCPANLGIGFQNDINRTVYLQVNSGLLNTSNGRIQVYDAGGSFRFTALNDSQITIVHTVSQLKVQGDQNRELRTVSSGGRIAVQPGNDVLITWDLLIEPLLPLMFILGLFGLCSIIGGSIYTIDKIKKHDAYTGLSNGVIIVAFGICLFISWLWAGVTG